MAHTNPIISKIKLPNSNVIYEICDKQAIHQDKIGIANGVAQLDSNGKVLASQLPSYDVPAITMAKIDEICGASIFAASEVEV